MKKMMPRKFSTTVFLFALLFVLDIKEVNVQRTYSSTGKSTRYGENQLQGRTKAPEYSEELKPQPHYDSRIPLATNKPRCRTTRCNKSDRRPVTSTTKPTSVKYRALKLSALAKNDTKPQKYPTKKAAKFSRMLDSTAGTNEDSGFVPMTSPRVLKKTPRRASHKTTTDEELVVKESRPSPTTNILGNGNFEILSGGVYSEDESNEIPEGRRMSRGYDTFAVPRRFRVPFNQRAFQFPSFYQDRRHQLPAHPMFFPRAPY